MSQLEIYGFVLAPPVRYVLSFCKLSGIDYVQRDINPLRDDTSSAEFQKISPNQEIPAIVHNGYNLWESGAIVTYLADAYNVDNQWYPKDLKIRGRIDSYLHWQHQGMQVISEYSYAKAVGPQYFGAPALSEEDEARYVERLNEFFRILTWILSDTHHIARTSQASIADIFAYIDISSGLALLSLNLEAYPEIKSWYDEIEAMPVNQELLSACKEAMNTMA